MFFLNRAGMFWTVLLVSLVFLSCSFKKPAGIPLYGAADTTVWYAHSKEAVSGVISLAKPEKLSYSFNTPLEVEENSSLELDYRLYASGDQDPALIKELVSQRQFVLEIDGSTRWTLPLDASFLGIDGAPGRIHYGVPLPVSPVHTFTLSLETIASSPAVKEDGDIRLELKSLGLIRRWYGFVFDTGAEAILFATPFVFSGPQGDDLIIDPPDPYRIAGKVELYINGLEAQSLVEAGPIRYEGLFRADSLPNAYTEGMFLPAGALPQEPYPLRISGKPRNSLELVIAQDRPFPSDPVSADPGIIVSYSQEAWRDNRFEIFRWDKFPSILIFDTADYAVQDTLFKRLAFFTEKTGFRGRLAPDAEIAELHGWNAHDYRAEDLARFFEAARAADFPLLPEERELEAILVGEGIIIGGDSGYTAGTGAVISLSRESSESLRSRFIAHEGFHGLFFIDEDFRNFSRQRWASLSRTAKQFILSYFDFQHYDLNDPYLMVNEFMAHCLQQPVSLAGRYFGETLAGRINESPWRHTVLPPRDEASGTWPEIAAAFTAETEAFSAYVNRRWGLDAGRVWDISVRISP